MKAVILAGGEGTRLRPLTCAVPKPMTRLCSRPILEYILDLLQEHGFREAVLTLKYLPERIIEHFENGEYRGMKLTFVIEDKPLGTAGSVRNAAGEEDVLVISGDALTDTSLTAVLDSHARSGCDATIVTSRVEKPGEFGLVVSDEHGRVTRFVEKPPYSQAVTRQANTGIYVLNKNVIKMIPQGRRFDFASELFPLMLRLDMGINAYETTSYWCDVGDIESYIACQGDILGGRVAVKERFAQTAVGRRISLAPTAEISEGCVIEDGCSIGEGAKITRSVLLRGARVGAGSHISGAVIGENARIGMNCGVFEQAVIGDGALVGDNAEIKAGVKIWPEKSVYSGSVVRENLKLGGGELPLLEDEGYCGEFGAEITPQLCVRLGMALAAMTGDEKLTIAASGGAAEFCCRSAVIAGITAAGGGVLDIGSCAQPVLNFALDFFASPIGVYVSGERLGISIVERGGLPLSRKNERALIMLMKRGEFSLAAAGEICYPSKAGGIKEMYASALLSFAPDGLEGMSAQVRSADRYSAALLRDTLGKLGCTTGGTLFELENFGREVSARLPSGKRLGFSKLRALAARDDLLAGGVLSLPEDEAGALDLYAERLGGRILRYRSSSTGGDEQARRIARNQLFTRDGLMTVIKLLGILKRSGETLEELAGLLGGTETRRRGVVIELPPSSLLERLMMLSGSAFMSAEEGVYERTERGEVRVIPSRSGRALRIIAEAASVEIAEELAQYAQKAVNAAADMPLDI